jgi:hypothetical protein
MKSDNFHSILKAYADILSAAGAQQAQSQIVKLATIFELAPKSNVGAVVERLRSVAPSHRIESPTLGDAARLLSPLKRLLVMTAKPGVSADVEIVEVLLSERTSMGLIEFARLAVEVLSSKPAQRKARSSAKKEIAIVRNDLVAYYQQKLEDSLADPERFTADYNELSSNSELGKPELVLLAKLMTEASTRTKETALKKIWNRHRSLMASKAKSRATGGRSAA